MTRDKILEHAMQCFFAAMRAGWAAGAETLPGGMPGFVQIPFRKWDFQVLDRYCISDAGSAGETTIWFGIKPVWHMSYGGHYPETVVKFLKQALLLNYATDCFEGGRGPSHLRERHRSGMTYMNKVVRGSSFESFRGAEFIFYADGKFAGDHEYFGGALI